MALIDWKNRLLRIEDPVRNVEILKQAGVKIGDNVDIFASDIDTRFAHLIEIGDNVTITNATILAHDASTKKFIGYSKCAGVSIGNNVFIGYGSIILPGTKVGNNVIVGAGAVVRGDIPDDSVVTGNPATVICRTSEYIERNKNALQDNIYDMNNPDDISKMTPKLTKGFVD